MTASEHVTTSAPFTPGARINGATEAGDPQHLVRPADGAPLARAGWVGADAVSLAVAAAVDSRAGWAATPARERAAAMRAIADDLRAEAEELAAIICTESGKRLAEARGEAVGSATYFDWFAEAAAIAEEEGGRTTPGRRFRVRHHPVGVVAALGTWNFPLSIPARKLAAALAAGCPTILKASERTPISADRLVAICERHVPTGVIGSLMGGPELATALIDHPEVAAISFTGSTPVGLRVGERAARSHTRAVLELGGKAPFIVRADADIADAAEHLMLAKLRNNGESCIAANNVFVHSSVRAELQQVLTERIAAVKPGPPEHPASDLGPLIDGAAVRRLEDLIAQASRDGAEVVRGKSGPDHETYMAAALVTCDNPTQLWDEEIFGPVLSLRSYDDEAAVVAEVNSWNMGLSGYVCGQDLAAAQDLAEQLRVGIVGINNGAPNTPEVPFGGFGGSGIGREGGMSGYREFIEEQTISVAR